MEDADELAAALALSLADPLELALGDFREASSERTAATERSLPTESNRICCSLLLILQIQITVEPSVTMRRDDCYHAM
jgi:hypothetical protein